MPTQDARQQDDGGDAELEARMVLGRAYTASGRHNLAAEHFVAALALSDDAVATAVAATPRAAAADPAKGRWRLSGAAREALQKVRHADFLSN